MTGDIRGWALRRPDGSVVVECGADVDESHIWCIGLGWPPGHEITRAQAKGARAFPCRIVELTAAPKT